MSELIDIDAVVLGDEVAASVVMDGEHHLNIAKMMDGSDAQPREQTQSVPKQTIKQRKPWTEGCRKEQNSGGHWLVRGPMVDQKTNTTITSKTLVNDIGLGVPNVLDPDPENSGKFRSNVIEYGYTAARRARRAA